MKYVADDVDVEMMGFMNDPLINRQVNQMANYAGTYGLNLDNPEVMQGFLSDFGNKIKGLVTGSTKISVTTDKGTVSAGGGQLTVQKGGTTPAAGVVPAKTSIMDYLKNPYIVAGLIGVPVLLLILSKKKKEEKE